MFLINTYLDKSKIQGVGVFSNENVRKGQKVKRGVASVKEGMSEGASNVRESINEGFSNVREGVDNVRSGLSEGVANVRNGMNEVVDGVSSVRQGQCHRGHL